MIFVSHDFQDRDDFANVVEALTADDIKHFDPDRNLPGESLRDKLRDAIVTCAGCIFIATRNSIKSSWCQAELGAFWGTGKRVCTFVADKGISGDDLPPQLRGDLWTGRIAKIAAAAREMEQSVPGEAELSKRTIGQLEVSGFVQLIRNELSKLLPAPREDLKLIRSLLASKTGAKQSTDNLKESLADALGSLIGMDFSMLDAVARAFWPYTGNVEAMHGRWIVHSNEGESGPGREVYKGGCILVTARDGRVVSAGAADWIGGFFDSPKISEFNVFVGSSDLGRIDSVY